MQAGSDQDGTRCGTRTKIVCQCRCEDFGLSSGEDTGVDVATATAHDSVNDAREYTLGVDEVRDL